MGEPQSAPVSNCSPHRAILYCRTTTDSRALARQEQRLRTWATEAGYEISCVISEVAPAQAADREGRARVLALAEAGGCDIVLIAAFDRWSHTSADFLASLRRLHAVGVALVVPEGPKLAPEADGRGFGADLFGALAAFERAVLVERRRKRERRRPGTYVVHRPPIERQAPQAPPWLAVHRPLWARSEVGGGQIAETAGRRRLRRRRH